MMWSSVSSSTPSILAALTMAGVGSNVFQTVNKAAVAQHAPPELVGTVMGMSGATFFVRDTTVVHVQFVSLYVYALVYMLRIYTRYTILTVFTCTGNHAVLLEEI